LNGPPIGGDQEFQGSKNECPGRGFAVSFGGRLYLFRLWADRLKLVATATYRIKSSQDIVKHDRKSTLRMVTEVDALSSKAQQ